MSFFIKILHNRMIKENNDKYPQKNKKENFDTVISDGYYKNFNVSICAEV